jgi:hypothetical protein
MKPARRASILADLEKAAPIAQAAAPAPMGPANAVEPHDAPGEVAQAPAPQTSVANPATAPQTVAPSAQWRTLPKKVDTVQFNVRIRTDLYEILKELATYSPVDSMTSIAARGIEKEIALMLHERGEVLR